MEDLGGVGTAVVEGAAAGGTGDGTGTGGGAGGAGGGEADGAGGAGTGAGEGEGGGAGAGAGEGEGAGAGEEEELSGIGDEEIDLTALGIDKRKTEDQVRKEIASLKKTNPEVAKKWGDDHYRRLAYDQEFPGGVNEARQLKETFEALGGSEGLEGLQTEVEDYRNEIKQFSEGDPALLSQLHEANKESFVTAISNGIDLIAQKSPELFDKAVLPSVVSRLDKAGMYTSVDQLLNFIKEGKGQEAYDLASQVKTWLDKAKGMANKTIELKGKRDPEREALDRDKAAHAEQKRVDFENSVASDVNRLNNSVQSKIVEPFFKELKLPVEGRREFVNALNQRIWKLMEADKLFQRAAKSILSKGEKERAARFTHAKFAELLPENFRKLRNAMYPNYVKGGTKTSAAAAGKSAAAAGAGAGKAAAGGGNGAGAGAAKVNYSGGKPARDDVDWAKTHDTMWIAGRAFLKNGKEVRFNWAEVK